MKCEKCIEQYLYKESEVELSFQARLHRFLCPSCRSEIERFSAALSMLKETEEIPAPRDFSEEIMLALEQEELPEVEKAMDLWKWVLVGVFIFFSIITGTVAKPYLAARGFHGELSILPLSIIFGILASAFGAFFIAENMERFSDFLHLKRPH